MNILIYLEFAPPVYLGGGETIIWSFAKEMIARGHKVRCLSIKQKPAQLDGIDLYPLPDENAKSDVYDSIATREAWLNWADLIWTQLSKAKEAIAIAEDKKLPILQFVMNYKELSVSFSNGMTQGISYIAKTVLDKHNSFAYTQPEFKGIQAIIRPVVNPKDYQTNTRGARITLINLNENKGGWPFYQLVKKHPEWAFLSVKGAYGLQVFTRLQNGYYLMQKYNGGKIDAFFALNRNRVIKNFSQFKVDLNKFGAYGYSQVEKPQNLKFREVTNDMVSVYNETEILLIMSKEETWGRVASEAMCNGIPVIYAYTPGLKEQIEDAGIRIEDRDDLEAWSAAIGEVKANYQYWSAKAKQRFADLALHKDLDRLEKICEALVSEKQPNGRVFIE